MWQPSWMLVSVIVLSLVTALLLIYFVVGSIVRYNKGIRHCPEVLPNYRFWLGLVQGFLVLITCGCFKPRCPLHSDACRYGGRRGAGHNSVLPSRPRRARHLTFEALQSDGDDDFNWDPGLAMQPSAVVTVCSSTKGAEASTT
ncbi:putative transmembrane protein [Trypanosoma rangeli]|uniref:Putative transmembrane protein n=1 Tax=Trypanosoma rangeli TaxID=5698 RepID=A0A3R7MLX5_TRYRA|nr:putative transmembrane protein [Trypanosoma rangeli]RNF04917.1 putative transmembrane protein [Trypanosoma rangeli]|eukprot:RNF04917.1 putative transmembrane protein [Trypanosoma rangeli]